MKNNFELYDSIKGMLAANKPEPKEVGSLSEKDLAAYAKKQPGSVIGGVDFGSIKESKKEAEVELSEEELQIIADNITKEEFEQLDELSKKTLGNYIMKASDDKAERRVDQILHSAGMGDTKPTQKSNERMIQRTNSRRAGIAKAVRKLTKEDTDEEIVEGIFSEDEITALLEAEQLDELSANTLRSYIRKNKADPKRIKTRGPTSKAQKAHIAKRDAGLEKAKAKIAKHNEAEYKKTDENHHAVINHVHEHMHETLAAHGYKHIGGDDKNTLYAKHLKGTAVMNHAIVHHPIHGASPSQNEHVLTLKSTTGWQDSSNDRHHVNSHESHDFRVRNTPHHAMTKLHDAIKKHDDYHAEKAKDRWLYK